MSASTQQLDNPIGHKVFNGSDQQCPWSAKSRLEVLMKEAATLLNLEQFDLHTWMANFPLAPEQAKLSVLRLMIRYQLDPLCDEVTLMCVQNQYWRALITIDGWSKLINNHSAFMGIQFHECVRGENQPPEWMECTIYRNDRQHPIVVREYYLEVATEHPTWKAMPHRMLRYRVLQQAARLAFGISGGAVLDQARHEQLIDQEDCKTQKSLPNEHDMQPGGIKKSHSSSDQTKASVKRIDQLKDFLDPANY